MGLPRGLSLLCIDLPLCDFPAHGGFFFPHLWPQTLLSSLTGRQVDRQHYLRAARDCSRDTQAVKRATNLGRSYS
jgi:hypothetical protein